MILSAAMMLDWLADKHDHPRRPKQHCTTSALSTVHTPAASSRWNMAARMAHRQSPMP
jgi:hypothetical protein